MSAPDGKAELQQFLQLARETLLSKLAGLSDYDLRRTLTPTGTNLLGLVKHLAGGEFAWWASHHSRVRQTALEAAEAKTH